MTDIPPSRYKVVERGRRLVVIDTRSGRAVTHDRPSLPARATTTTTSSSSVPMAKPSPVAQARRTEFDGRAQLVTQPFYDRKGPRTLALDPGGADMVQGVRVIGILLVLVFAGLAFVWPWLLLAPLMLTQRPVRDGIRSAVTTWLDRYDHAATDSSSVG
ncbi:hypothetical protein [Sphingomonas sp.]|uniref:hypothetical protein n=1 Tax=Sphingomonas sp. TaxID=28214 RepID=UPI002CCC55D3|nr:hypothetical protein [Sphingomonas sp.]HWK36058.1 hypothetical protein [Sphingomonas sp.]